MGLSTKTLIEKLESAVNNYDVDEVERISKSLIRKIRDSIVTRPKAFVKELDQAVDVFDHQRATALCSYLIAHLRNLDNPYPLDESKTILGILRRKRYFDLIILVADALMQSGQTDQNIRRQYAQALVDNGQLSASFDMLQVLEKDCVKQKNQPELDQARGLMGRVRKQMYVDATVDGNVSPIAIEHLKSAVSLYYKVYRKSPENIWHGVNLAALMDRARRDNVPLPKNLPSIQKIGKEVLLQITSKKAIDIWSFASAGESCLALQDYDQAFQWYIKYTKENDEADAFEYSSTLRQLEEVWQLSDSDSGQAKILNLLRAAVLKKDGGSIEIKAPEVMLGSAKNLESNKQFERILGDASFKTHIWLRNGLSRAMNVVKIRAIADGKGIGSGFVVRGEDIHPNFGGDWVVITNAHVVSNDPSEHNSMQGALSPDEAVVCFEGIDSKREFEIDRVLFSSPRSRLDCTILKLAGPLELETTYPIARNTPVLGKGERVYIIGYPGGNYLSFSMDDNLLLDHDRPFIHYRAPTEGGSSGSPVFNANWELLALHHAGGLDMPKLNGKPGTYQANEGLLIKSIKEAVASEIASGA